MRVTLAVISDTGRDGTPIPKGRAAMADDRPAWARRMANERKARGWSQAEAVRAMRAHAPERAARAIRACCGSGSAGSPARSRRRSSTSRSSRRRSARSRTRCSRCPAARRRSRRPGHDAGWTRWSWSAGLQRSDLDEATLDGLRIMADRLCSEYPFMPARPAPDRRPGLAPPDHCASGPAAHPEAAPGDPGPGGLGRAAGRRASSTTPATGKPRRPPARPRCRWAPRPTTPRSRPGRTRCAPGST